MPIHLFKKQLAATVVFIFLSFFFPYHARAQKISDTLLHKITARFENQGYKKEKVIQSVNNRKDGLPTDIEAPCLSGKEMLVVAVFAGKPQKPFARMLVEKHYNKKIAYDEHPFQNVAFDEGLNINYSLVNVAFPAEANKLNCGVNLQVYDKASPATKVWLLVFSK